MKARAILFFLLALIIQTNVKAEDFYYKNYDIAIQVHEDNSYSVVENMDVFFTAPRHGIVREWNSGSYMKRLLPGKDGTTVEKLMTYYPSIEDIDVSENYFLDTESGFALRIGDPDIYVEGDRHYTITYEYKVGDDRTNIDDLFYFSLLGGGHETNTDTLSFCIHFDKAIPQESLSKIKLLCGKTGNDENSSSEHLTLVSDSLITGCVTGLNAYEAVTIYLPLPEGYYTTDGSIEMENDKGLFWFILLFVTVMVCVILVRECKPRNNFTKVIEYWPPTNLSSADLGYIYDTTVDPCDIISLIPYFANKGLLTIDTTSGHPVLTKVKDIDKDAPEYQKKLFHAFFAESDEFDTDNPPRKFAERWLEMDAAIKKENKGIANEYSWVFIFLYTIASLVMMANLFMCDITNNDALGLYGFAIFAVMSYIGLTSLFVWDATMNSKWKRRFLVFTWIIAFGLDMVLFNELLDDNEVYLFGHMDIGIGIAYTLFLFGSIFMMRLGNMSRQRLRYIGHILGLKEFIEKSEKPLLDSLIKEHETYFYDILPYAVAFGLSDKWAKQFEGLNVKPADWYRGNDMSTIGMCHYMNSQRLYSNAMQNSVSHLIEANAKAAASSGSGGGFSGGGFGGGGSHSW